MKIDKQIIIAIALVILVLIPFDFFGQEDLVLVTKKRKIEYRYDSVNVPPRILWVRWEGDLKYLKIKDKGSKGVRFVLKVYPKYKKAKSIQFVKTISQLSIATSCLIGVPTISPMLHIVLIPVFGLNSLFINKKHKAILFKIDAIEEYNQKIE
tara:strand:- start:225 stop:683 length:459 start_codon:yes stop_codon:yes gene_type:complete